jgi:uncharacterized protein YcfJ
MASSIAAAADFVDTAQVVSATPIIDRVTETRQECGNPPASPPPAQAGVAAPIIGGVAGAILGNQVGRGSGRTAATVAGAIGGAIVGDAIGNRQARADANAQGQRCRTIESTREVVNGYNVVYRYNGRDVSTVLPYHPGGTVQVGVGIIQSAPPSAGYAPPPAASVPPPPGVVGAPNPPLTPASNVYRY